MTRLFILIGCLAAPVASADVLGLNDYDALFAENADQVTNLDAGTVAIDLGDGILISREGDRLITLDQTAGGAVGCFVRILSQIDAFQQACDAPFTADQMALHAGFLAQVLDFYAANTAPASEIATATQRYRALVDGSLPNAATYCDGDSGITAFMQSVLAPQTQAVVDTMTATPRLPVDNPCL